MVHVCGAVQTGWSAGDDSVNEIDTSIVNSWTLCTMELNLFHINLILVYFADHFNERASSHRTAGR